MSRYRRFLVEGGAYFFTVTLADRSADLLVRQARGLLPEDWGGDIGDAAKGFREQ